MRLGACLGECPQGAITIEERAAEELRSLCSVHLEVLDEGLEEQKPDLTTNHPIGIFMAEHKIILQNLDQDSQT